MSQINEYITQINNLNYNKHCRYVKNKLLSVDSCDISLAIFFKKLHVILHNLHYYLAELDNKINGKGKRWFDFWDELHELHEIHYFDNNRVIMQLKCINLTNNTYQISVPLKGTPMPVISYINVDWNIFFLMFLHIK